MTERRQWAAVHVFYAGDVDRLLLDAVAPAVRPFTRDWFFLRYWEGGPHLRVRMLVDDQFRGDALRSLTVGALAHLRAHPTGRWPSPHDYAETAERLAAAELMQDHDRVLRRPDTVEPADYLPEIVKFGSGAELAAAERHFRDSSALALGLIRSSSERRHLHTAATVAIVTALLRAAGSGAGGFTAGVPLVPNVPVPPAHKLVAHVADLMTKPERARPTGFVSSWIATTSSLYTSAAARRPGRALWLVDYCAHLLCNRLGVTPTDERELRRIAKEAVAAHFGRARSLSRRKEAL